MIHTLKCPSCAAPLDYEDDSDGASIRCPFCNNLAVVPESMRRSSPQAVVTSFGPNQNRPVKLSPVVGYIIIAVVLLFVGGILFGVIRTINSVADGVSRTMQPPPRPQPPTIVMPPLPPGLLADPKAPAAPAFASAAMQFGTEGIGPGSFSDARSIALDGEGRIYVGEYTGGRIQVFDREGKFITQWFADRSMPLRALAADRRGTVYVVQRGKIQRFEGATGQPLGEVPYPNRNSGFDDVVVAADGQLVAAWDHHTDDIVRLDPAGRNVKVISKAMSGQTDRSELNLRVAVDGSGNLYALGTFNEAVVKYTPDGRFVNRFGGQGGEPGQFRAAQAIAVDNKGRVYVSDIKGVQVFDANGRYLDTFKPDGSASGMVFNDQNELFVAARHKVVKYTVKP